VVAFSLPAEAHGTRRRRSGLETLTAGLIHAAVRIARGVLPAKPGQSLERWRRGREQARRLERCDSVIVSYGKSGRTWLRVMLSRYLQRLHGLPDGTLLSFDNYRRLNPEAPCIELTHDNYLRYYTGAQGRRADYYDKRVVLMIRQPQDVAVSQYHHWKHRKRSHFKRMDNYPDDGTELSLLDFVLQPRGGLPRIISWMNEWAQEMDRVPSLHIVRYEDLRSEPEREFANVVAFLLGSADPDRIAEAVRFGAVGSMRQLEQTGFFANAGPSPMRARDPSNPDSAKVRRARAGGYREDFDDIQLEQIDGYVAAHLDPVFGYNAPA